MLPISNLSYFSKEDFTDMAKPSLKCGLIFLLYFLRYFLLYQHVIQNELLIRPQRYENSS